MISKRRCLAVVFVFLFAAIMPTLLLGQVPMPVSYELKVKIDPAAGSIAVRGKIEVPRNKLSEREISFGLHETFDVKELSVNGHKASVSFRPTEHTPINPATRNVVVSLPGDISGDRVRLEIEYAGHLKEIPE
jgi:hypothetical protein